MRVAASAVPDWVEERRAAFDFVLPVARAEACRNSAVKVFPSLAVVLGAVGPSPADLVDPLASYLHLEFGFRLADPSARLVSLLALLLEPNRQGHSSLGLSFELGVQEAYRRGSSCRLLLASHGFAPARRELVILAKQSDLSEVYHVSFDLMD